MKQDNKNLTFDEALVVAGTVIGTIHVDLAGTLTAKQVVDYIGLIEQHAISRMAISEFISTRQAHADYGLSMKTLRNNNKLMRTRIGRRVFLVRNSVEAFKNTGNGRLLLTIKKPETVKE